MKLQSTRLIRLGLAVTVALLLAAPVARAQTIDPELQSTLDALGPADRVSVIVRFAERVALDRIQSREKRLRRTGIVSALRAQSSASLGAVEPLLGDPSVSRRAELWAINGVALTASAEVVRALAHDPAVARISADAVIQGPGLAKAEPAAAEWNLDAIRAPELWAAGFTGSGVVIGSMDTGVDATHPDLAASYRGGTNSWLDPYGEHDAPHDRNGHGTQSMGVMVGGAAGGSAIGAAPGAQWIAVKIFNDADTSSYSAIHLGYQWMLDPDGDPDTDDGADVVNNSWSLRNIGSCSLEFEQDLQVLRAAEVAVVFSGGNYGSSAGTSVSPANNPSGFGVGFINDSNTIHVSSSRGPSACDGTVYPDVVAPGVNVRTTDLGALYSWVSGSSIAAPHISGGMALLLSAHPAATVEMLEQALMHTAVDLGAAGPDQSYGHGRTDLVVAEEVLSHLVAGGAVVTTTYTDEAEFLAAVSHLVTAAEGFEDDGAWGAARSPDTLPSVTSQGITWSSNHPANQISTSGGAAYTGDWGLFSDPHGDQSVPNPTDFIEDGVLGTSVQPLAAVGGWFRGTAGSDLRIILDGDDANPIALGPVDAVHRFYGVVVENGFESFEFREIEGTLEDQKYIFVDDVTVALADGGTVPTMDGVVAGVANLPGAQGSDWHSDLYLHNAAAAAAVVELYFSTADGVLGTPASVTVGPDQTLTLEDVVASAFGEQGSGAISWRVVEGDPNRLLVSANTYNRVDAVRSYGQQIPGVGWGDAAPAGSRVLMPALAGRYRTNLGFATDGDCSVAVVRGYDRSSRLVAQRTMAVQPWSWIQLNSLFGSVFPDLLPDPDNTPVAESLHRFEVTGINGRVVGYTSIIDNATSDGSYMIGQVPGGTGDQWLPGAAVILGAQSSDWRSDVVLMSTAGVPYEAEVAFYPAGQDNSGTPDSRTVPLEVGESVFEGNILAELFGYAPPAVGSLAVAAPAAAPLLWMRTYTEEPAPGGGTVTYGQAILPRNAAEMVTPGSEGRVAGFSHDATTRANLILQNTRTVADGSPLFTSVLIELLGADGALLHEQSYLLEPGEYRQLNRFVDDTGVGSVQGATLRVTVLDLPDPGVTGGVDAMVSEVNGNTVAGTNDGRLLRAEILR